MTLAKLELTDEERQALRKNGFIAMERHRGRERYKLRFCIARQQKVRVLGTDPTVADAVRQELALWQADRRMALAAAKSARDITFRSRAIKEQRAQLLAKSGFHFHGRTLRRSRLSIVNNKC